MDAVSQDMILSRKHAPKDLGRVLVLGLGKSGKAVTRYCAELLGERVESLFVAAGEKTEDALQFISSLGKENVEVVFDNYSFTRSFDLCIASPGISQFSEFYQNALSVSAELISEVEFAWRESERSSRWVAITGTNGKTTTTALTAHILKKAGMSAEAVGNIGETCLETVQKNNVDTYVAEVSSYQLASTKLFAPDVAILLNITPDHLAWHGSHEEYIKAKANIFNNLDSLQGAYAVLNATDEETRSFIRKMKRSDESQRGYAYIPIGNARGISGDMRQSCGSECAAFVQDEYLCLAVNDEVDTLVSLSDMQIKGEHNVVNALAAASAAKVLGVNPSIISGSLCSFLPLEHRIEPCGTVLGVACFNDSKATNVDATLKALTAFGEKRPLVLLGGEDKGTALDDLVSAVEKQAKAVICFGAAGPRFAEAFAKTKIPLFQANKLEAALDEALKNAKEGDVVVLSPACASFDEFTSFEHRGNVFKQLVKRRTEERGE